MILSLISSAKEKRLQGRLACCFDGRMLGGQSRLSRRLHMPLRIYVPEFSRRAAPVGGGHALFRPPTMPCSTPARHGGALARSEASRGLLALALYRLFHERTSWPIHCSHAAILLMLPTYFTFVVKARPAMGHERSISRSLGMPLLFRRPPRVVRDTTASQTSIFACVSRLSWMYSVYLCYAGMVEQQGRHIYNGSTSRKNLLY